MIDISNLNLDELRYLNQQVCDRMKRLSAQKTRFIRVGQRVAWEGRFGLYEEGEVLKVNRQTVKVLSKSGSVWRVSASLLKEVRA